MAVPEFQTFMLPLLTATADGLAHRMKELVPAIADALKLSDEDRATRLPSAKQGVAENRVYWAGTYLRKAGLLVSSAKGIVAITDEGRRVLETHPARIDSKFLKQYPAFVEFKYGTPAQATAGQQLAVGTTSTDADVSPEEQIESGWQEIRNGLGQDLLETVKKVSPAFFERLVVDVLLAMGYGGSRADASRIVGKSGDGGIDGTISEDKLGLDVIYVQAKRWEGSVGGPVVNAFAGSLQGVKASKGVLITTSHFTQQAKDFVGSIAAKIVLIDGARLVDLMIEHNVGVEVAKQYELKKIDHDYFDEGSPLE